MLCYVSRGLVVNACGFRAGGPEFNFLLFNILSQVKKKLTQKKNKNSLSQLVVKLIGHIAVVMILKLVNTAAVHIYMNEFN